MCFAPLISADIPDNKTPPQAAQGYCSLMTGILHTGSDLKISG